MEKILKVVGIVVVLVVVFFCGIWYANSDNESSSQTVNSEHTEEVSVTNQNEPSMNSNSNGSTLVYASETSGTVMHETYRFVMVKTPDGTPQLINKKIADKNAPPLYEVGQVLSLDKYSIVEAPGVFHYKISE